MASHLKGLVLAAGLGTRLRPLTDLYPKPLMPFAGSSPLELALWSLATAGIREVAVNSHHRAEAVASFVATNPLKQDLLLAHEPEILGTGGVFNPLRSWLGDAELLVLNGDVVSTLSLLELIKAHRQHGSIATMALLPSVLPGENAIFHAAGRIVAIGKTAPKSGLSASNFACAQILTPAFLDLLPKSGAFDVISQGYQKALSLGLPIGTYLHSGYWHDMGTPSYFWQAVRDLLRAPTLLEATGVTACRKQRGLPTAVSQSGVLRGANDQLDPLAKIGPEVVIEDGCTVLANANVSESILLPGTVVARGEVLHRFVAGPSLRIELK